MEEKKKEEESIVKTQEECEQLFQQNLTSIEEGILSRNAYEGKKPIKKHKEKNKFFHLPPEIMNSIPIE